MAKKPEHRNRYLEGMDQDSGPDKTKNTKYYKGINIEILTEDGLSSGNIRNVDGNAISFNIPDTLGFWKIKFDNIEEPTVGTLYIKLIDINSLVYTTYNTGPKTNIEDLYAAILSLLTDHLIEGTDFKLIRDGEFINIIPLNTKLLEIDGGDGLGEVDNTFEIEPQTGLKIIGWTTLRDDIILFTTNEVSETPSSAGQIWKFSYDPETNLINDIGASSTLTLADHLIYNNKLNFSTYWHIGTEAIGHYENSQTGRVYWTDEYNQLRTINALDPDLLGTSVGDLGIVSNVDMSTPVVQNVTYGGTLNSGAMMQYAYRLSNVSGGQTVFSPLSNPVPLGDFDASNYVNGEDYDITGGTAAGAGGANKSVIYNISGIDTSYNLIEHIAIQNLSGTITIYKFDETEIPSDGTVQVHHMNIGLDIPITEVEFATLSRAFKRCKTITVKDKRLIAANLDTLDTSIDDWDARAYRFGALGTTILNDTELSPVTLNNPTLPADFDVVPEKHDCINPYNKDENLYYRFQTNGTTLGGTGKFISYNFTTQDIPIKSTIGGTQPINGVPITGFHGVEGVRRNSQSPIGGDVQLNGEDRGWRDEFQNFKGPTMSGAFTGYARGEVYRFGIVFYDKSGNPFNVKWIGDIKFPEAYDTEPDASVAGGLFSYQVAYSGAPNDIDTNSTSAYTTDVPIWGRSLGIEFTVDVSEIQPLISGYEIVRVKREETDKTRLGTGIFTNFTLNHQPIGDAKRYNTHIFGNRSILQGLGYTVFGTNPAQVEDIHTISINGGSDSEAYTLPDSPNTYHYDSEAILTGAFISPTTIMDTISGYSFKPGTDKLKSLGFYNELYEGGTKHQVVNKTSDSNNKEVVGVTTLGYYWQRADSVSRVPSTIDASAILAHGALVPDSVKDLTLQGSMPFLNASGGSKIVNNNWGDSEDHTPAGLGDTKQVVRLTAGFPTYGNDIYNPNDQRRWRECSYDRTLTTQYGGDTFEARSRHSYISTGAFVKVKEYSTSIKTYTVFGGDTFVHQFSYLYFIMHWDSVSPSHFESAKSKYHLGWNFPVESSMNLAYMNHVGRYGTKSYRDWYSLDSSLVGDAIAAQPSTYIYDRQYSYQNETKAIFYPPDFIENTVEEHPHMIWASEKKIDGELYDSWRSWLVNNKTEVDGQYGQINKIATLNDTFLYWQDRAFGAASINDKSVINDEDGIALALGSGGILDDYKYISRTTGTTQKFSVIPTDKSVHYFDTKLLKWMRYVGGGGTVE